VLVSGDLADHGSDEEYAMVQELLAPLNAPLHVLTGNHDDRGALRRHFGAPDDGDEPVQYAAEIAGLRLLVLDTQRPGEDDGELDEERLAWLDAELARDPGAPTMLAMHHPPVVTGIPAWDAVGLASAAREGLAAVLSRHPQVQLVAAGHVHCALTAGVAGCQVLTVPSTYVQMRPGAQSERIEFLPGPAAFAVHSLRDGELVSYVVPVA
jgi:3',5'-cyclic AMP phosphodiesterase CpdA